MPGAKIINRDFESLAVEPGEVSHRFFFINHRPLGHLQHHVKMAGGQGGGEAQHIVAEAVGLQMRRGNIQPQLDAARQNTLQRRRVAGDQRQQVIGQRHDHLLGFREVNKDVRRDFAHHRMAPAHQNLHAHDPQGLSIHHRLIDDVELVVFDPQENGFSRIGFDRQHVIAEQPRQQAAHHPEQQSKLRIFRQPAVGIQVDLQR